MGRRVRPVVAAVAVAGGRHAGVERLAHGLQRGRHPAARSHLGVGRAQRAEGELHRRLRLGGQEDLGPELRAAHEGLDQLGDVAVGGKEGPRGAVHERGRRLVGHQALGQLAGDEARGGGVAREVVEQPVPVVLAAAGGQAEPEDALGPRVVLGRPINELAARAQVVDAPPREAPRRIHHVGLGVAGVDADGVQLHQLAPVVLVDAADDAPAHRPRHRVQVVVEVEDHGRVLGGGAQQVAEAAEGVWPYGVALVGRSRGPGEAVGDVDVEVVEPEVDHHFLQLVHAVHGADRLGRREVVDELSQALHVVGAVEGHGLRQRIAEGGQARQARLQLGVRARLELLANPAVEPAGQDRARLAGPGAVTHPAQEMDGGADADVLGRDAHCLSALDRRELTRVEPGTP